MSIPTDIKLTNDRSWEVDETGDIATVTDEALVEQDPVVRLFNEVQVNVGSGVTQLFIQEFEQELEDALDASQWVSPPYDVRVTNVEGDTLTVSVSTGDDEFIIERRV